MSKEKADSSTMSTGEKVEHFENTNVQSPFFTDITTEPTCRLIIGDTGCGKTTIARFCEKDYPMPEREDAMFIPILHFSVPSPAIIKGMGISLPKARKDPLYGRGTTNSINDKLCMLIKKCEGERIILDESQYLIDKENTN